MPEPPKRDTGAAHVAHTFPSQTGQPASVRESTAPASELPPDQFGQRPAVKIEKGKKSRVDETVEGGKYVVDAKFDPETGECTSGRFVDANGKFLEGFGDFADEEPAEDEKKAEKKAPEKAKT